MSFLIHIVNNNTKANLLQTQVRFYQLHGHAIFLLF